MEKLTRGNTSNKTNKELALRELETAQNFLNSLRNKIDGMEAEIKSGSEEKALYYAAGLEKASEHIWDAKTEITL